MSATRPFHCGSQFHDWKAHNCDRCAKGYDYKATDWRCDLERKIDEAAMGDGSMPDDVSKRMGTPEDCRVYNWPCTEFVEDTTPKPEPPPSFPKVLDRPADWIREWAEKKGITLP
jgi:hypothetical protein